MVNNVLIMTLYGDNVLLLPGGRRKTALSLEDIRRVTRFVLHYAEQHSLVLPGRVPGFKRDDVKVLFICCEV